MAEVLLVTLVVTPVAEVVAAVGTLETWQW